MDRERNVTRQRMETRTTLDLREAAQLAREAHERRLVLAELAELLRSNPFLAAEF
jgi:hypothetical protein